LSAEVVGVAVHPSAAHPESARDIAHPDESIGWRAQFGRYAVSDRLDVLVVERHDLNREDARLLWVASVDALRASPPLRPGGIASQTRRSKWHLDSNIVSA